MNRKALRDDWTKYAEQHGLTRDATSTPAPSGNKYGAKKIQMDGYTFDSKAESQRYFELKMRERAGEIADLELQPVFPLHIMRLAYSGPIALVTVGQFTADFRYLDLKNGEIVIEDKKSEPTKTEAYRLRKKIAEAVHGVTITEV